MSRIIGSAGTIANILISVNAKYSSGNYCVANFDREILATNVDYITANAVAGVAGGYVSDDLGRTIWINA